MKPETFRCPVRVCRAGARSGSGRQARASGGGTGRRRRGGRGRRFGGCRRRGCGRCRPGRRRPRRAREEALEGLVEGEERGDGARVAEDHDESGDGAGAVSDADLAEGAPVDLRRLAGQGDDAPVDGPAGLGPQALDDASKLVDRTGIAALTDHLVDAGGAEAGVLGQGVADERQIGVEGAGSIQAGAAGSRLALDGGANRLTVVAELGGDGPDLPVLAVVQAPDLGAFLGRDHRPSFPARREAPASGSANGSTDRRPRTARVREPGRRQGRGVCPMAGVQGKCDPSRGGGRGRRAAGRGGRDALRDCADGGPWRLEPPGGERPSDTMACSRHGRGRTPRRRRRDGCTDGRLSGGGAGPRRRSARGGLRLDNEPEPWQNSRDRLGLSELGAVTRARWAIPGPHPTSESALYATRTQRRRPAPGAVDAAAPHGRKERAHRELGKPQRPRFPTAPTAISVLLSSRSTKTGAGAERVDKCREFVRSR